VTCSLRPGGAPFRLTVLLSHAGDRQPLRHWAKDFKQLPVEPCDARRGPPDKRTERVILECTQSPVIVAHNVR
jgi:hypothetical protein